MRFDSLIYGITYYNELVFKEFYKFQLGFKCLLLIQIT